MNSNIPSYISTLIANEVKSIIGREGGCACCMAKNGQNTEGNNRSEEIQRIPQRFKDEIARVINPIGFLTASNNNVSAVDPIGFLPTSNNNAGVINPIGLLTTSNNNAGVINPIGFLPVSNNINVRALGTDAGIEPSRESYRPGPGETSPTGTEYTQSKQLADLSAKYDGAVKQHFIIVRQFEFRLSELSDQLRKCAYNNIREKKADVYKLTESEKQVKILTAQYEDVANKLATYNNLITKLKMPFGIMR
jgi:hypothetical protein